MPRLLLGWVNVDREHTGRSIRQVIWLRTDTALRGRSGSVDKQLAFLGGEAEISVYCNASLTLIFQARDKCKRLCHFCLQS